MVNTYRSLFLVLCVLGSFFVFGQKQDLSTCDNPQCWIKKGNHFYYDLIQKDSAFFYYRKALNYYEGALQSLIQKLGERDADVATNYIVIASLEEKLEQYPQAIESYQKAASIQQQVYGAISVPVASTYAYIGKLYLKNDKKEDALSYLLKSVEIRGKLLPNDDPSFINCYNTIAYIYNLLGDFDQAILFFNKTLVLQTKNFTTQSIEAAATYSNLGILYNMKALYDSSIICFHNAIAFELQSQICDTLQLASDYLNLGSVYSNIGLYDTALIYLNDARNIYIQKKLEETVEMATICNNMGSIYDGKGDLEKALSFYQLALQTLIKIYGEKHSNVATTYSNIGIVYSKRKDFEKAMTYFEKSLSIRNSLGEVDVQVAINYNNIGTIYQEKGNNEKAIEYYKKALYVQITTLGENHLDVATSYNNIGSILNKLGRLDGALDYYQKALVIQQRYLGEQHPEVASTYSNIGNIYFKKGDYPNALTYLDKSCAIQYAMLGNKNPLLAFSYNNIGKVFLEEEQFEKALVYFQKAIIANAYEFNFIDVTENPAINKVFSKTELYESLKGKAIAFDGRSSFVANQKQDLAFAITTYELAIKLLSDIRNEYSAEASKLFLAAQSKELFSNAVHSAMQLYLLDASSDHAEKVFEFIEKSKNATLLTQLYESDAKKFADIPDSLLNKEKQLKEELTFYLTQIQKELQKKSNDTIAINTWRNKYFALSQQYEELIKEFEKSYPKYFELKYQSNTSSISTIQQALGDSTAVIEYFISNNTLYIVVINNKEAFIQANDINNSFEELVYKYYRGIKKVETALIPDNGHLLYNYLIRPVNNYIQQQKTLIIIPDEYLWYIPFETLITNPTINQAPIDFSTLSYLIQQCAILYNVSASQWMYAQLHQKQKSLPDNSLIGFAPVFNATDNQAGLNPRGLDELAFSEEEIMSIASLFKAKGISTKGFFHAQATKENLKESINSAKYIHIATHGNSNDAQPSLSYLAFAAQPDKNDDGSLYASEMYNLNIRAELVVLSSCESGIGKLVKGEGLLAMTRGFLYSGTPNIIFSLWKVADKHTKELMLSFYEGVLQGKTYAKALQDAKCKMIIDKKSAFPRFWSGFVMIGL